MRDTSGKCTMLPLLAELAKYYHPDVEVGNVACTVFGYLIGGKDCATVVGTINQVRARVHACTCARMHGLCTAHEAAGCRPAAAVVRDS